MIPNHLNNPEMHDSYRRFLRKYLRKDISEEDKKFFEDFVQTVITITKNEFNCAKCKQKLKLYAVCLRK
jgi:type III secretory pathway component EscR